MSRFRRTIFSHAASVHVALILVVLWHAAFVSAALAQSKDLFAFIPAGGRSLLADIVASRPPADWLQSILQARRTRAEWLSFLTEEKARSSRLAELSDDERETLADYLAANMPLQPAASRADLAKPDFVKSLPPDGRDFVLEKCQGCHIVTVVVTQKRSREAWLGTMNKPSHSRVRLSRDQREALADYLVIQGGIPIENVPKELRAGGASY